jgi:hypothetical protein
MKISCDRAEFTCFLWKLEDVQQTSDVRVEIPTETDRFTTLIPQHQFRGGG